MARTLEERLLAGDPGAVAEVESWVRRASASFAHRLGDDRDDVVQQSMLEVVEALRDDDFRGDGPFRAYVWRTTSSNCLDRLRWRRRWVEIEIDTAQLPPREAKALTHLLRREARDRLAALAARQPAHCRELWREILAGRSYRDMSERLGVSEGALRVRVSRCRERARATWLEESGNEPAAETPYLLEDEAG